MTIMKRTRGPIRGLTRPQRSFVLVYLKNGNNGVRAYLDTHPACTSYQAAATEASRTLKIPKVAAELERRLADRWERLKMDGDEALARVSADARADIRELYDPETGALLPVHLWPDSVAGSVRAIRPGLAGTAVQLNDSQAARRIILEQTGRLKNPIGELARLLAGPGSDDGA